MSTPYSVIDSSETVRYAFSVSLPLDDLLEFPCLGCKEAVFLTRKQHAAYVRESAKQSRGELAFVCTKCQRARLKMVSATPPSRECDGPG